MQVKYVIMLFLCLIIIGCSKEETIVVERDYKHPIPILGVAHEILSQIKKLTAKDAVKIAVIPFEDKQFGETAASNQILSALQKAATDFGYKVTKIEPATLNQQDFFLEGTIIQHPSKNDDYVTVECVIFDEKRNNPAKLSFLTGSLSRQAIKESLSEEAPLELPAAQLQEVSQEIVDTKKQDNLAHIRRKAELTKAKDYYREGDYNSALYAFKALADEDLEYELAMKVYAGLYQSNIKLEYHEAAREAFGKLLSIAMPHGNFNLKFFFEVDKHNVFNTLLKKNYDIWLKELHQYLNANQSYCLHIIGHTSKTGSCKYNLILSQNRAGYIQSFIDKGKSRTQSIGKGFLEARGKEGDEEKFDRRVEFQVVDCNQLRQYNTPTCD